MERRKKLLMEAVYQTYHREMSIREMAEIAGVGKSSMADFARKFQEEVPGKGPELSRTVKPHEQASRPKKPGQLSGNTGKLPEASGEPEPGLPGMKAPPRKKKGKIAIRLSNQTTPWGKAARYFAQKYYEKNSMEPTIGAETVPNFQKWIKHGKFYSKLDREVEEIWEENRRILFKIIDFFFSRKSDKYNDYHSIKVFISRIDPYFVQATEAGYLKKRADGTRLNKLRANYQKLKARLERDDPEKSTPKWVELKNLEREIRRLEDA